MRCSSGRDDNSYFGRVQVPKKNCHPDNKVTKLGITIYFEIDDFSRQFAFCNK
jgi:hypothetical protein